MYLHLGENVAVNSKSIVAMIDLENSTVSRLTKEFLKNAQQSGRVVNVSAELPKSAVVCENKGKSEVFISQISTATLQKRAGKTEGTA
ncbi:MAG: DUF370 domain-containing protein [Clostridiales bacterium]|jgi:hypothetical protein|nr:DUF370 domain-containing protein [Clostridiales bacterium]